MANLPKLPRRGSNSGKDSNRTLPVRSGGKSTAVARSNRAGNLPAVRVRKSDRALFNDLQAAIVHESHPGMFWTLAFMGIFLVVFIVWAYFAPIEEVARGQGAVIPSSREQVIQSLDPGVLSEMLVHEGDIVEKGQILLRMDDTRSTALWQEVKNKVVALEATAARLRAEAFGTKPDFPAGLDKDLIAREQAAYQARTRALDESLRSLAQSRNLLAQEIRLTEPMAKKGVVSDVELLRMKRQAAELDMQIAERKNKFQADANLELVKVEAELAQAQETVAVRADPVRRAAIRAPLKGIVKNIKINTVGGVISPGQDIMEIVPLEGPLLVEAWIRPSDVAFITPNAPVVVKLSAYDYALYGGLDGKVTLISPDTLQNEKRPGQNRPNQDDAFYRVIVTTNSNTLTDKNGQPLPIIPGMIATVDIKTGEKTVFQYLVKPITRLKQALRER